MNRHIKQLVIITMIKTAVLLTFTVFYSVSVYADNNSTSLVPPNDPRQSITYWKKSTIDKNDPLVKKSQQVFSVLLRAWDQSRIEPGLYVVESDAGAWAASLADGNILLSKQAIEVSYSFGEQRGEHLLAFVLAHELAHQRADDLWHQRFFRMIDSQPASSQKKMMAGLDLDSATMMQLEQKEAQADHDGLVLMSSVGYDPYQIVNDKDFFTLWVENIWNQNCADSHSSKENYAACKQAQARTLRAQAELKTVATQSMLYELGVQAFVAADYQQARKYFTIYGRDYPGRAIISAIGLSYFAEAQDIQKQLNALETNKQPDFYYPLILDAKVNELDGGISSVNKRADIQSRIVRLQDQKLKLLEQSIRQFEKSINLAPDYKQSYLLLAAAHLLANNSYRVRGVLQGQYIPRFGEESSNDPAIKMLLALTSAIEGDIEKSITSLKDVAETIQNKRPLSVLADNVLRYSVFYNLAELYQHTNQTDKYNNTWLTLANLSQKEGDTLLFRLALSHLGTDASLVSAEGMQQAPSIDGHRLGDKIEASNVSDLWIDGEKYQISMDNNSRYITQNDGTLISAWVNDSNEKRVTTNIKLELGDAADRPFKALGMPDRRLNMTSGEYLAYDMYGLAIRISDNRIKGWFLYESQ